MFAYCGNCTTWRIDRTGYAYDVSDSFVKEFAAIATFGTVAAAAVVVLNPLIIDAVAEQTDDWLAQSKREVYDFAQAVKDLAASTYDNQQPRVHHIIPHGSFSNRSTDTQNKVREMQTILRDVGIDPQSHPLNLMVISHGYHKSLHTDSYLNTIYTALVPAAGNRSAVEHVLFNLRIVIASGDPYAMGY